jgi:hypothetical protein
VFAADCRSGFEKNDEGGLHGRLKELTPLTRNGMAVSQR